MSLPTTRIAALAALTAAAFAVAIIWRGKAATGDKRLPATLKWREAGESDLF
jgi:hypothetical protein